MKQISNDNERLNVVAHRLAESGRDITAEYNDWVKIGFACASVGEDGREAFHLISGNYPRYSREECDEKFSNCLRTGRGNVTLGTLFKMASDAGIDTSLPKGRPRKSQEEKEEAEKKRFAKIREWLEANYEFRYNTIKEQTEVRTRDEEAEWKTMDDRQMNSLLTELHAADIYVSKGNLESYIESRTFSPAYNPIKAYAEGLKPWRPTQKDYIGDMFAHLGLADDENLDFKLEMARKWFVRMVAVATELAESNQTMLILMGEQEGTGKTYFVERFLPRELRRYIHRVVDISNFKDKDELLPLARNMVAFLDEIKISKQTVNKLKNYVGGGAAGSITERSPYAHHATTRCVHVSWIATTNEEVFLPSASGNRRYVILHIDHRGRDYKTLPTERAIAQAYYLATHPKAFNTEITPEEVKKLKEINQKYVQEDLVTSLITAVLRHPKEGEKALAVTNAEIIGWLNGRFGYNRDFNPTKIGNAMRKNGFESKRTNNGRRYLVVRLMATDLEAEAKKLAENQESEPEQNPELPF